VIRAIDSLLVLNWRLPSWVSAKASAWQRSSGSAGWSGSSRACREDSLADRTRQEHDWANQAGTIGASRGASEGALPGKTCRHGWSFAPGLGAALVSVYTT